jgi:hypothetical protein
MSELFASPCHSADGTPANPEYQSCQAPALHVRRHPSLQLSNALPPPRRRVALCQKFRKRAMGCDAGHRFHRCTVDRNGFALCNIQLGCCTAMGGCGQPGKPFKKKRKEDLAKSQDFKPYLAFRAPRKLSSNCTVIRIASGNQLIDGTLVGAAPSLFHEAGRTPVNLATDP